MNEPWFADHWSWLPGTLLGVLAGCFGCALGFLAPRGHGRAVLVPLYWILLTVSGVLLVAGLVALVSGQPYGVWYGLGLAGLIGVLVLGFNGPVIFGAYRQAELRKLQARDLGSP